MSLEEYIPAALDASAAVRLWAAGDRQGGWARARKLADAGMLGNACFAWATMIVPWVEDAEHPQLEPTGEVDVDPDNVPDGCAAALVFLKHVARDDMDGSRAAWEMVTSLGVNEVMDFAATILDTAALVSRREDGHE